MRANNRSAKPRKQWRLLRRAKQARRAEVRLKTRERVRRYTREARRNGADATGLMQATFRGVYEDALRDLFSSPPSPLFEAFPFGPVITEAGQMYVEAELPPLPVSTQEVDLEGVGEEFEEPIRMTIPEGWEPAAPDDEKPDWPFRWKPKAWLEKRGFKRLLPEPWP